MKQAMIRVDRMLRERKLLSALILQIHDELVFEVPLDEVEVMKTLVKEAMEGAVTLSIPLKVSISVGSNWGEL
jgi:DNA polymerase-1